MCRVLHIAEVKRIKQVKERM